MASRRARHEVATLATLADLRPAPYNPRAIDPAAAEGLGRSLVEFGDISGIVWNGRTGHLVAGHQRVAELVKAHGGDLPIQGEAVVTPDGRRFGVRVVDWPEARERAANVAANSPLLAGEWAGGLGEVLAQIEADDAALYAALRLDDLAVAEGLVEPPPPPADDVPPEVEAGPADSKPGEVYELGPHRVLCGDSTKPRDVATLMGGQRAVLMATDPPYGVAYDNAERPNPGVAKPRVANDDLTDGPAMQAFLERMLAAALPHMHPHAAFYFWHPMLTQGTYVAAAAAAAGILIHRQIIWVKPTLLLGRGDYHWRHELCFYGWVRGNRPPFYGPRNQDTIWEVESVSQAERKAMDHATPKPMALWDKPIGNHTKPGEVLYEPFAGSGAQFVAAARSGRVCFGMEIAPAYVDVIRRRYTSYAEAHGLEPGPGALA